MAVNKVNIRQLSQTKKLFSNYFQKFLLATNELGTGLDLGDRLPTGFQSVTHVNYLAYWPCCLGADGHVVMFLIGVDINTEIFLDPVWRVQCGETRGSFGL